MALPLVPIVIAGLAGAAYYRQQNQQKGVFTVERRVVYETALQFMRDPVKLRKLADGFEEQELNAQATVLRKRAALRELPRETQLARRAAFRKAMASKDVSKVQDMANAFRNEGATGAADALDKYAEGLEAAFAGDKDASG